MAATTAPRIAQLTAQSVADRLKAWLGSAPGQQELERAFEQTERELAHFAEAQKVDPKKLQMPVTV